ncbi:MAG: hypothetical protein PF488_00850 [Patescibacteria group bacterium]|jgi:hypothetical protein|nr:hypothetical protein [Patescibacteria group bacterium]
MDKEEREKRKERNKESFNYQVSDPDFINDFVVANYPPENIVEDTNHLIFSFSQND